jgi:hypothetical protein
MMMLILKLKLITILVMLCFDGDNDSADTQAGTDDNLGHAMLDHR